MAGAVLKKLCTHPWGCKLMLHALFMWATSYKMLYILPQVVNAYYGYVGIGAVATVTGLKTKLVS